MPTRSELIEKARAYWDSLPLIQPVADEEVAQAIADFCLPLLAAERERALKECEDLHTTLAQDARVAFQRMRAPEKLEPSGTYDDWQ